MIAETENGNMVDVELGIVKSGEHWTAIVVVKSGFQDKYGVRSRYDHDFIVWAHNEKDALRIYKLLESTQAENEYRK